jgi:hypothetical protein
MKVRTGVYAGFSIGGKVTKRDPTDRTIITGLRLVEISLVDSPCNPDAALTMWKAETMYIPPADAVVTRAKDLAKAAGTKRFADFLFDAQQELVAEEMLKSETLLEAPDNEGAAPAAVVEEPVAEEVEAVEEPVAEVVAEGETSVEEPEKEAAATVEETVEAPAGEEDAEKAAVAAAAGAVEATEGEAGGSEPSDPAAVLAAALASADVAAKAAVPVVAEETVESGPFADLDAAAAALKAITVKAKEGDAPAPVAIQKSMWDVSRFADILCSMACVQRSLAFDAEYEGDGSPIPAELADAINNLGGILVRMAQEEVAELVASLVGSPDMEIIIVEEIGLANEIVDAVKADEALVAAATERLAKRAPVEVEAPASEEEDANKVSVETLAAENERLSKALADATPAVEAITAKFTEALDAQKAELDELRKRFEAEPLPAKTAGPAVLRTVAKSADSEGGAAIGGDVGGLSPDDVAKYIESLPEAERGHLLVKAALARPTRIALPTAS